MNRVLLLSLAVIALLIAAASPALAEERTLWVGRDLDNNRVFWTCSNAVGDDWTLTKNGKTVGELEGVTSTSEYVELQMKGIAEFSRVRLYKDKLSMNKQGSKTQWIQMAKGKWSK